MALGHCHTVAIVSRSDPSSFKEAAAQTRRLDTASRVITRLFRKVVMRSRVSLLARVEKGCTGIGAAERRRGVMTVDDEEEDLDHEGGMRCRREAEPEAAEPQGSGGGGDEPLLGDGCEEVLLPSTETGGEQHEEEEIGRGVMMEAAVAAAQDPSALSNHEGVAPPGVSDQEVVSSMPLTLALMEEPRTVQQEMCHTEEYEEDYEAEEEEAPRAVTPAAAAALVSPMSVMPPPPAENDAMAFPRADEGGEQGPTTVVLPAGAIPPPAAAIDLRPCGRSQEPYTEVEVMQEEASAGPEIDMAVGDGEEQHEEEGEASNKEEDSTSGDGVGDKAEPLSLMEVMQTEASNGSDNKNYCRLQELIRRHAEATSPESTGSARDMETGTDMVVDDEAAMITGNSGGEIEEDKDPNLLPLAPPMVAQDVYLPPPMEPRSPPEDQGKSGEEHKEGNSPHLQDKEAPEEEGAAGSRPIRLATTDDAIHQAAMEPSLPPPPPPPPPSPPSMTDAAITALPEPHKTLPPANVLTKGMKHDPAPSVEPLSVPPPPRRLKKVVSGSNQRRHTCFGFGSSSSRSPGGLGKAAEQAAQRRRENIQKRLEDALSRSTQPPARDERPEAVSPTVRVGRRDKEQPLRQPGQVEAKRGVSQIAKRAAGPPSPTALKAMHQEGRVVVAKAGAGKPTKGASKQPMKAADLRTEFNYFREKYCKNQEAEGGDHDFGEFLRKKTSQPEEEVLCPDGPHGEGGGAEDCHLEDGGGVHEPEQLSPPSHLDEIYHRSVGKMHRRLGNMMVHHLAMRLPRNSIVARQIIYSDKVRCGGHSLVALIGSPVLYGPQCLKKKFGPP